MATHASISPYFDESVRDLLLEIAAELREFRQHWAVRLEEIQQAQKIRLQEIQDQWKIWRREQVVSDIRHLFSTSSWSFTDDEVLVDVHHLFDEISEPIGFTMMTPALLPLSIDTVVATKTIFGPLTTHAALLAAETPTPSPFIGLDSWSPVLDAYLADAHHLFGEMSERSASSLQAIAFWPTEIGTQLRMCSYPPRGADDCRYDGGAFFQPIAHQPFDKMPQRTRLPLPPLFSIEVFAKLLNYPRSRRTLCFAWTFSFLATLLTWDPGIGVMPKRGVTCLPVVPGVAHQLFDEMSQRGITW